MDHWRSTGLILEGQHAVRMVGQLLQSQHAVVGGGDHVVVV